METFHLANATDYRREYARLGAALGMPDAQPAPGEVEFLSELTAGDWQGVGMLAPQEMFFAAAVTSILRPSVALEIGTASGFSAALIGKMIALREAERGAPQNGPLLHTIDKHANFVLDPTQPVGFAIERVAPGLRERVALHPGQDSSFCAGLTKKGELRFAFVDGNHRHPWPLADVLRLHSLMERGWILMHDVDLPAIVAKARSAGRGCDVAPVHGAKHVFDFWPGEKVRSGNLGAIKVWADPHSLGQFVDRLRRLSPEVSAGSWSKRWRAIDELLAGSAGADR